MMVGKETLEIQAMRKSIYRKIGIVYILLGAAFLFIGFSASAIDFYGWYSIRSNMVLSVIFGFLLILGGILLMQGVIFIILGITKKGEIRQAIPK